MRPDRDAPPDCPECGKAMVPVVVGLPGIELVERFKRGEVILGGYCPSNVDGTPVPRWGCADCWPHWLVGSLRRYREFL